MTGLLQTTLFAVLGFATTAILIAQCARAVHADRAETRAPEEGR